MFLQLRPLCKNKPIETVLRLAIQFDPPENKQKAKKKGCAL